MTTQEKTRFRANLSNPPTEFEMVRLLNIVSEFLHLPGEDYHKTQVERWHREARYALERARTHERAERHEHERVEGARKRFAASVNRMLDELDKIEESDGSR